MMSTDSSPPASPDGFPQGRPTDMHDLLLARQTEARPLTSPGQPWQPPTPAELQQMLPQYEIHRLLGRGGMGAVYQGRQVSLDRMVAVKILSNDLETHDPSFAERFKNEARAMAKLSHPGIISVYDFGETPEGLLYLVMEYVEGTDVQKMITGSRRLHTEHAMAVAAHVCDALHYAHERGIIHRDIKPANIMVGYDGVVKVADFGLAKVSLDGETLGLTQSGMAMGTPHYIAPEALILGTSSDRRADIYAVGVMLYQMLTGKLPHGMFEMPSIQVPGLDPRYDAIITRAMREDRDQRYATAAEMRADLDGILTRPVVKADLDAPAATMPHAALPTQARPQRPGGQRRPQAAVSPSVAVPAASPLPWIWIGGLALLALAAWVWMLPKSAPQVLPVAGLVTEPVTAITERPVTSPPPKRTEPTAPKPAAAPAVTTVAANAAEIVLQSPDAVRVLPLSVGQPRLYDSNPLRVIEAVNTALVNWQFTSIPQRLKMTYEVQVRQSGTLIAFGADAKATRESLFGAEAGKWLPVATDIQGKMIQHSYRREVVTGERLSLRGFELQLAAARMELSPGSHPLSVPVTTPAPAPVPVTATQMIQPVELAALDQQFVNLQKERVTAVLNTEVSKLNSSYLGGLEREISKAQSQGNLDAVLELQVEKQRVTAQQPMPVQDEAAASALLKSLRGIYREAYAKLENQRVVNLQQLVTPLNTRLLALESELTKAARLDDALAVRAYRQKLASTNDSTAVPESTIFNGQTLAGWKIFGHPSSFTVEEGAIKATGAKGNLMYVGEGSTLPQFTDFDLSMKVKTGPLANSGIFLHTVNNATSIEAQIANDQPDKEKTGSLWSVAPVPQIIVHDGEWFDYRIVVRGQQVTLFINGREVNRWTQPANWVPPVKVPNARLGQGSIGIQSNLGMTWIKDIRLKTSAATPRSQAVPMDVPSAPLTPAVPAALGDGFTALFDGQSLNGWSAFGSSRAFSVDQGAIRANGAKEVLYFTGFNGLGPRFKDYELKLQVKTGVQGNSGVWLRCAQRSFSDLIGEAIQIQIANENPDARKTGSILGMDEVSRSPVKDGEWFLLRITVVGRTLTVFVNERQMAKWTQPKNWPSKDKKAPALMEEGFIGLESWSGDVWFKAMEIRPLNAPH